MSRDFPDWVDPVKAAAGGRRFAGTMPLAWMQRVSDLIAGDEGEIAFRLAFDRDTQGHVRVAVHISGHVPLVCQRTLVVYDHPLDAGTEVAVVESEAAAATLPEDCEPVICSDRRLALVRLVEEELLLALPLVPRRPDTEPPDGDSIAAPDDEPQDDGPDSGPFAELARLRRR